LPIRNTVSEVHNTQGGWGVIYNIAIHPPCGNRKIVTISVGHEVDYELLADLLKQASESL